MPKKLSQYFDYQFKADTYTQTIIAGFTFNQEPVKIEVARCAPVVEKYLPPLSCGLYENIEEKLTEFNNELRAAGVDAIKKELEKQLNLFLSEK